MPFISEASQRERRQQFGDYVHQEAPEFGEVFAAAVGQVFDEELSISSSLNREGFQQRKRLVDERIAAGDINPGPYRRNPNARSRGQPVDYNRIAVDLQDPEIKTDEQLHEERNALLAQRRRYAQDVIERGSGIAQFTGGLTAYMLDPINIATIGIAVPATTARATSVLGRAALASRNAVLIEGATELGIQTLVFQHKQAIDSPYGAGDALANIGMAATGAAVLGGAAGGLSTWLEKVVKFSDDLPQTKDVIASQEYLQRLNDTIVSAKRFDLKSANPVFRKIDREEVVNSVLIEAREELIQIAGNKLDRGTLKSLNFEKADIQFRLNNIQQPTKGDIQEELSLLKKNESLKKSPARVLKKQARDVAAKDYDQTVNQLKTRLNVINKRLASNEQAAKASSELSMIDQGILPDRYKRVIDNVMAEQEIKADLEFLQTMGDRAQEYGKPSRSTMQYVEPTQEKPQIQTVTSREREILSRQGIAEDYDADIQAFNELESPVIRVGDEELDPAALIKDYDDELAGLDDVLKCAYG